jgi:non-heme chloroperoxidase
MDPTPTSVRLPSGVTLDYVVQGPPSGVPLLLLHAIADSRRAFDPVMRHLPGSIRALAMSQRGHGDSERPDGGYRPEDFASDLAAFMDALDLSAAVVAGGSSGGVVARRFAIDHPGRTLGLVLLGSPLSLGDKPGVREMWESTFSKLEDPVDPVMVREFVEMTIAPSVPRDLFEVLVEESLKPPAHVWRETMLGLIEDGSASELGKIAAPTLILWGDQDTILSREDQETMADRILDARLVVYEGAGHTFYWEDPVRVAADLVAFVESLDA